jgi:hypothetical protein
MEAKLAEFRKRHAPKKPLIDWHQISSRFTSIFSFSSKKSDEQNEEVEIVTNWQIIMIKLLLWLTLLIIFIRLEFGIVYFIISLLYLMWSTMDSRRRRNELSAYSVFNPNCEKIQGTFSAEDYDRQLRGGGSPFFSSFSS